MDSLCLNTSLHGVIPAIKAVGSGVSGCGGGVVEVRATAAAPSRKRRTFGFSFKLPLTPFWSRGGGIASRRRSSGFALDDAVLVDSGDSRTPIAEETETERRNGSWVLKILDVQSLWRDGEVQEDEEDEDEDEDEEELNDVVSPEEDGGCDVSYEENRFKLDRDSLSKLLKRVSLPESKLYAQMSYLGNLAYSISKIKVPTLNSFCFIGYVSTLFLC